MGEFFKVTCTFYPSRKSYSCGTAAWRGRGEGLSIGVRGRGLDHGKTVKIFAACNSLKNVFSFSFISKEKRNKKKNGSYIADELHKFSVCGGYALVAPRPPAYWPVKWCGSKKYSYLKWGQNSDGSHPSLSNTFFSFWPVKILKIE